jgi:hypothetical protein
VGCNWQIAFPASESSLLRKSMGSCVFSLPWKRKGKVRNVVERGRTPKRIIISHAGLCDGILPILFAVSHAAYRNVKWTRSGRFVCPRLVEIISSVLLHLTIPTARIASLPFSSIGSIYLP